MNGVIDYFEALDRHHFADGNVSNAERTRRMGNLLHSAETANLQPLLEFLKDRPESAAAKPPQTTEHPRLPSQWRVKILRILPKHWLTTHRQRQLLRLSIDAGTKY